MLATSHALTGAVILKIIPDPRIAFPLAFLSHFALDLVPHWDFITNQSRKNNSLTLAQDSKRTRLAFLAALDTLFGFTLTFWLFQDLNPTLLFGAIVFSQLPDWLEMPYFFWGINFPPSILTKKLQRKVHWRMTLPWGLVSQIVYLTPLLLWVR